MGNEMLEVRCYCNDRFLSLLTSHMPVLQQLSLIKAGRGIFLVARDKKQEKNYFTSLDLASGVLHLAS